MTARDRVLNAFEFKPVDRIPILDIVHSIDVLEHYGGEKITPANAFDVTCRALSNACDLTRAVGIPDGLEERRIEDEDGFVYSIEWWTSAIVHRPFSTAEGLAEIVKRDIDDIYACMEKGRLCPAAGLVAKLTGQGVQTPEELQAAYAKLQARVEDCVIIAPESLVGLSTAYVRAGLDLFCLLYADDPELVSRWLEALCAHEIWKINKIADPKIMTVALTADDIACNSGQMFSDDFLRKELYPRLRRVNDAWKRHGVKVLFHTDGDKNHILPELVATGIEGINPMEPLCNMDVSAVRKKYPNLVVTAMVDCSHMLPYGTVEEVQKVVRDTVDAVGTTGVFVGSSTEVHPACKLENVVAMYETAKEYGRNADFRG